MQSGKILYEHDKVDNNLCAIMVKESIAELKNVKVTSASGYLSDKKFEEDEIKILLVVQNLVKKNNMFGNQ